MDASALHFYPASPAFGGAAPGMGSGPLARYLPPLPPGMAAAWLAENAAPGSWLLDPLGASPALAIEAARAGYRVLVASNNPIISFIIETLARAPKTADFQSALAELASARRGEERLEPHILSLYLTECDTCGERVPAQAFLWRRAETHPFARQFRCPRCGESTAVQRDVTPADIERLDAMGGDKLQRARALQRVILNETEHRADVEEALENYLPRSLYALFTMANKVEGLGLPPERLRLLQALLLSVFDAGSTLWGWPSRSQRPKQLTTPPQFRENNLWLALEAAVEDWAAPAGGGAGELPQVQVTRWPELPSGESGICLYRGRVKALMPLPGALRLGAVLTVFPRPNQAFWTLSVLWSGWLWGAEAALPLRSVLDRRRYDWNWHTSAIHNALAAVRGGVEQSTPFFGLLPELAPGFLSAVLVAAGAAGFRLAGLAQRSEAEIAQALWLPAAPGEPPPGADLESAAREGIRADLAARNEPAAYLQVYAAGLAAMASSGAFAPPSPAAGLPGDMLTRVQAALARTLADRSLLRLYGTKLEKGEGDEERGAWWLQGRSSAAPVSLESSADASALPLADRVEMEVVRFMQKRLTSGDSGFILGALDAALCAIFPGPLTPPADLLRACLESYGEPVAPEAEPPQAAGLWRMRQSESAAARRADLNEMRSAIEAVGRMLGFATVEQSGVLAWEQGGTEQWWFFRMASSILSRYVLAAPPSPPRPLERCVLVLPGSRARLLAVKLRRDPRMTEVVAGWRFLKFRQLRAIAGEESLSLAAWEALLDEDPLTDEATQMRLFSA